MKSIKGIDTKLCKLVLIAMAFFAMPDCSSGGSAAKDENAQDREGLTSKSVEELNPEMTAMFSDIPPAKLESLVPLLKLLEERRVKDPTQRGGWASDKLEHAAKPVELVFYPSTALIVESDIGDRIERILMANDVEQIWEELGKGRFTKDEVYYSKVALTGIAPDGMLFSVAEPKRVRLDLKYPGYKEKETPDTILDYAPELEDRIRSLPEANVSELPKLVRLLDKQKALAKEFPGKVDQEPGWLGGGEYYIPSHEELIESEIGDRIENVVRAASPSELREARTILQESGFSAAQIDYGRITFSHVDAMGSGRYFRASQPAKKMLEGLNKIMD